MANLKIEDFAKEVIKNLPYRRGFIVDDVQRDFSQLSYPEVEVIQLTQQDIDDAYDHDMYEGYPIGSRIIYIDAYPVEYDKILLMKNQILSMWKKGEHVCNDSDVRDYVTYEFVEQLY